ncbi:MAG: hypothetical protein J0H17_03965, partial [Rhizobiales bacterium]|nr:hypothetical protein [Hyphomicrobiales bacterium]
MMRALRYLLLAGALALGSPRPAQAGFLVPVVTFLASGTFLAQLAWAGIGLGVTWAASKIQGNSTVGGAQLELRRREAV